MRRDVTVRFLKNLQHEILIGKHKIIADEPTELGGDDAGPSPQMLLVGALGAWIGITMRMYAQRKGWDPGQVEIHLEAEKSGHGAISGIKMHIEFQGTLSEEEQSRLREIATRCPTHKVLSTGVPIVHV